MLQENISRIKNLKTHTLKKIFHKTELTNKPESLAGIFAAKEACKKVFNLNWLDIEIKKERTGKPIVVFTNKPKNIIDYDLSISHDGNYAIAIVVFLMEK